MLLSESDRYSFSPSLVTKVLVAHPQADGPLFLDRCLSAMAQRQHQKSHKPVPGGRSQ